MNQKESPMHLPRHVQEKFEEEIRAEIIRQQTEQELRNNPLYKSYFEGFNESSVDSFIRNYARRKALYVTRGPEYLICKEQNDLKYKLLAEESLWAIQQKKLFNLQCDWRAEKIKLKGVEHSTQFRLLAANIQHCPFISPVSRAEVELYISYLRSGIARPIFGFDNWQDYESFRAEMECNYLPSIDSEEDTHIPQWYLYYDEQMGTSRLMTQSDIRGEKENKYRSVARQKQLEKIKSNKKAHKSDPRPYLSIFDLDQVEDFIRKFEDRKTLELCRAVEDFQLQLDEHIELEDAIQTLRNTSMQIPVRSCNDWRKAVIEAAQQYEFEQIAQVLPTVHQEYQFRVENGINFPQSLIDKKREEHAFQLCEIARQQIVEGRIFLGENGDLYF